LTATGITFGHDADPHSAPARIGDAVAEQVDRTCQLAIVGRRASRALAAWAKPFGISEAELQLLWQLGSSSDDGLDQTALARALAFSPAQICACVERLSAHAWICARAASGDRRRNLWQLSEHGRKLLDQMAATAALLQYDANQHGATSQYSRRREAAA
jgi:DNA-binding MarR family transcriptional regulator